MLGLSEMRYAIEKNVVGSKECCFSFLSLAQGGGGGLGVESPKK